MRQTLASLVDVSRGMIFAAMAAGVALIGSQSACSRKPSADLAQARPVMEALLQAEREHRASHGNYWRDRQPKLDRNMTVKVLGVDLAEAPDFEFTIDPPDSGMDPKLRVTARGKGEAASVVLSCVQDAAAPKPECTEAGAAAS